MFGDEHGHAPLSPHRLLAKKNRRVISWHRDRAVSHGAPSFAAVLCLQAECEVVFLHGKPKGTVIWEMPIRAPVESGKEFDWPRSYCRTKRRGRGQSP